MFFGNSDKAFFDLFERAADNMVRAAELFQQMLLEFDRRTEILAKIREAEHHGDYITHDTMTKLDQTFITPLEREDIHHLITETDDVVDAIDAAAQRIILYHVEKPNEDILKHAEVGVLITKKLAEAIRQLRNLKTAPQLPKLLIEIHELENRGDDHNHAALARLFQSNDPMYVIKWKELYDLVENGIDACEDVAHTIQSIMVKNA